MKHHKLNTQGFALWVVIAVILVTGITGGVGYFVYSKHTKTAPASATTTKPQAPAPSKADTTPKSAEPTTTGADLTIKEWGISIPLPDSLKDAYYVASKGSADPDGSVNTVWLGLKSKDTETCGAALGNVGGSTLGAVVRTLPTDIEPIVGKPYSEVYTGVVIGKYFYGYGASVDTDNKCGSADSRRDINASFGAAVKGAKVSSARAQTAN